VRGVNVIVHTSTVEQFRAVFHFAMLIVGQDRP
jgi:hypothetical protein